MRAVSPANMTGIIGAVKTAAAIGNSALRTPHSALSYASDWRSKLAPELSAAAREPMSAVALIYALLLSRDADMRAKQLATLQTQSAPGIGAKRRNCLPAWLISKAARACRWRALP